MSGSGQFVGQVKLAMAMGRICQAWTASFTSAMSAYDTIQYLDTNLNVPHAPAARVIAFSPSKSIEWNLRSRLQIKRLGTFVLRHCVKTDGSWYHKNSGLQLPTSKTFAQARTYYFAGRQAEGSDETDRGRMASVANVVLQPLVIMTSIPLREGMVGHGEAGPGNIGRRQSSLYFVVTILGIGPGEVTDRNARLTDEAESVARRQGRSAEYCTMHDVPEWERSSDGEKTCCEGPARRRCPGTMGRIRKNSKMVHNADGLSDWGVAIQPSSVLWGPHFSSAMGSGQGDLFGGASMHETPDTFATWINMEGQQGESPLDRPAGLEWHDEQARGYERQVLYGSEGFGNEHNLNDSIDMHIPEDIQMQLIPGAWAPWATHKPVAEPSSVPGALGYPDDATGDGNAATVAHVSCENGQSVFHTIDPHLLYAEENQINLKYAESLDSDRSEEDGEEDLDEEECNDRNQASVFDGECIRYPYDEIHGCCVINQARPSMLDTSEACAGDEHGHEHDAVAVEAQQLTGSWSIAASPPLRVTRSQTHASSSGNSSSTMTNISQPGTRGRKRQVDNMDEDDSQKVAKKQRSGEANDDSLTKQKTKAKATETAKAKSKTKVVNTRSKVKGKVGRLPCLEPGCGKTFGRKGDRDRHFRRSCTERDPNDLEKPRCKHCKVQLSRGDSIGRHIKRGACRALKPPPSGSSKESGVSNNRNGGRRKSGDKGGHVGRRSVRA
ncbi:predicted protein [Postia placenta Mad-698-R]|uniref:Uncharacterized protein n=1 Tax=Postia placenta MAD-698-R-SB12 TaxID=670580 RepID=A0A1X6MXK5_9APHY|nr:hypothetical protein POSPLADRAFT_1146040 [Postia placenta MAD-698-R-SB12]EED85655.1 predicted protein [Postia placenta Mad-698-R]OSX60966.1 hypothetical protein POSPLADRAFT_1146040 [Postia placenta MAD-698-R-SB12]